MKLYVSGPMTGIADFNYPAFHLAKEMLEGRGYDVISPADLPIKDGWDWIDYIMLDIDSVFAVDGVANLDGWERSRGARIENKIALGRGIPTRPIAYWLELAAETATATPEPFTATPASSRGAAQPAKENQ